MPAGSLTGEPRGHGDKVGASADHVAVARALLFQGELRRNLFPSLLRQPAWDMLLAAYVALHESVELTPASLCACSGEPPAAAHRWLRKMEAEGLVRRRPGERGARIVVITEGAALRLQHLLRDLISESPESAQQA